MEVTKFSSQLLIAFDQMTEFLTTLENWRGPKWPAERLVNLRQVWAIENTRTSTYV